MNYNDLINQGLLKQDNIGFDQINRVIERAYKNIKSAKVLLDNDDEEGAFRFAYDAMLLAGRALIFSYNLRPRAEGSHKIVVDFIERVLGAEAKILVNKFDKMRKKRHYLIYGISGSVSGTEANNAIENALELLDRIKKEIQDKNPQQTLFSQ